MQFRDESLLKQRYGNVACHEDGFLDPRKQTWVFPLITLIRCALGGVCESKGVNIWGSMLWLLMGTVTFKFIKIPP